MNFSDFLRLYRKAAKLPAKPRGAIAEMPQGKPLEPDPGHTGGGMV
jgi:hypothetical protein